MNLPVSSAEKYGISTVGMAPGLALMFNDQLYERCKDIARIMAGAKGFTPPHLLGQSEACFSVVTMSITWKLNPANVAGATYVTPGGKIGFEGKLVQAILENSGALEGPVRYEHIGDWTKIQGRTKEALSSKGNKYTVADWKPEDEAGLGVKVIAQIKGEQEPREFVMMLRDCQPRNSTLWALRPSQQICYTAVRAFGNVAAPGILMGVPFDPDDDSPMIDITPSRPQRWDSVAVPPARQSKSAGASADKAGEAKSSPVEASPAEPIAVAEDASMAGYDDMIADWTARLKAADKNIQDEIFETEIEPQRESGVIFPGDYNALIALVKD